MEKVEKDRSYLRETDDLETLGINSVSKAVLGSQSIY